MFASTAGERCVPKRVLSNSEVGRGSNSSLGMMTRSRPRSSRVTFADFMITAARVPRVSTGGGSAALLSDVFGGRLLCNHPALSRTRNSYQFACRDLHQFLPTGNIFDDERSLLPSSRNIAHRS